MAPRAKKTLSRRVFGTIFVTAMVLIMALTAGGAVFIQRTLADSTRTELSNEAEMVALILNTSDDDLALLQSLERESTRITLIDTDGTVLYDSENDASTMPNHKNRPEVKQAFNTGSGASQRASSTLGEVMLYRAIKLSDGSVIRLAQSQAGVGSILLTLLLPLLVVSLVLLFIAFVVATRESQKIIAPLQEVDLDHPFRNIDQAYKETAPMLERLEAQRKELKRQMAVVEDNDRMRREFTANITHELKTPLTTISGYAELIENNMVSDEADYAKFGKRIHSEARRLAALVNDILTLSNLDEAERSGAVPTNEQASVLGSCELIDLSQQIDVVAARLEQVAETAEVKIWVDTTPVQIMGVARLIDELVYNLASNAIRYNKSKGTVFLGCGLNEEGLPFVCVADTGIGIAPEEQQKVFERFYRVDKSRSKARGGTGLGLAIVKHAAALHNATLDLKSDPGRGTIITVTFPEQELPSAEADAVCG